MGGEWGGVEGWGGGKWGGRGWGVGVRDSGPSTVSCNSPITVSAQKFTSSARW